MKKLVKNLARAAGWDIKRRVPERVISVGSYSYNVVRPEASYSPWLDDGEFLAIYRAAQENTLVDIYRCFELWSLVCQLANVPGDILEVGVWRGGTGSILARAGAKSGRTIHLADTFKGVVKAGPEDPFYVNGEHADTSRAIVEKLLADNDIANTVILEGIFPDDFPGHRSRQFAFVHVDVDVFESARQIVDTIWPQMPVGGMIVFDDFGFVSCNGIAKLVNSYIGIKDRYVVQNLNGHAILIKLPYNG